MDGAVRRTGVILGTCLLVDVMTVVVMTVVVMTAGMAHAAKIHTRLRGDGMGEIVMTGVMTGVTCMIDVMTVGVIEMIEKIDATQDRQMRIGLVGIYPRVLSRARHVLAMDVPMGVLMAVLMAVVMAVAMAVAMAVMAVVMAVMAVTMAVPTAVSMDEVTAVAKVLSEGMLQAVVTIAIVPKRRAPAGHVQLTGTTWRRPVRGNCT